MKKILVYSFLFLSPFLLVIIVNETNRPTQLYKISFWGQTAYASNPSIKDLKKCNWDCHNNGCSHRKSNCINKGVFIPYFYQKILNFNGLNSKENDYKGQEGMLYKSMNIIFLVILWPLFMFTLLIANIELFLKRKRTSV